MINIWSLSSKNPFFQCFVCTVCSTVQGVSKRLIQLWLPAISLFFWPIPFSFSEVGVVIVVFVPWYFSLRSSTMPLTLKQKTKVVVLWYQTIICRHPPEVQPGIRPQNTWWTHKLCQSTYCEAFWAQGYSAQPEQGQQWQASISNQEPSQHRRRAGFCSGQSQEVPPPALPGARHQINISLAYPHEGTEAFPTHHLY